MASVSKAYTQLTLRIPMGKERYRQAVECLEMRDRSMYRTQADYITAAILALEGIKSEETASLEEILEELQKMNEKISRICDEENP